MDKRKYRSIAGALALATSFATINFAPVYAAEPEAPVAAPANQAGTPVNPAPGAAKLTAEQQQIAAERMAKMEDWRTMRPAEDAVKQAGEAYAGQTVVAVTIDEKDTQIAAQAMAAVKIKAGDALTTEAIQQDRQAIYETGLFYDVYPTFEAIPEGVKITYHVMENPVLQGIEISGNKALDTNTIKGMLTVPAGQILNSKTLNSNISEIEARYRKDGFILAKVSNLAINDQGILKLGFNEGILEGYTVKGNEKTKAYVITREMRLQPGEPFNVKKARRSMQRINNLGFFEDVSMKLNPGREPNSIVLETTVVEKRTGTFGIGAGYSSTDGVLGMIQIGDKNFRGLGDAVNLTYEFGAESSSDNSKNSGYLFSYTRPWLDKKETTGTIRVYNRTHEYDDYNTDGNLIETYNKKYSGGEITLGRAASEYSTNYITLRNRTDSYDGHVIVTGTTDRSADTQWLNNNFGLTRSIIWQHVTDTRDNIYKPTEGNRVNLTTEFAGLGGDFDYQKYTIENNHYIKVGHAQVLAMRAQYGHGDGNMPESAQYQLGGQDTLRGYRDDQFEGENMFLGSLEYRFPLVSKVSGALFTDFGNAWNDGWSPDTLHKSVGVGLMLDTPLGSLRFDVGHGEDGNRTHFSIGGSF